LLSRNSNAAVVVPPKQFFLKRKRGVIPLNWREVGEGPVPETKSPGLVVRSDTLRTGGHAFAHLVLRDRLALEEGIQVTLYPVFTIQIHSIGFIL